MSKSRFKTEYERWAYQIFDESVECLKDGLHHLPIHPEGEKLVVYNKKREHAVFSLVRYIEICDSKLHDAFYQNNSRLRAYIRELFIKYPLRLKEEQESFMNFLSWLTPLAVDIESSTHKENTDAES